MDNLSKYLEDVSFIGWIYEPTPELDLYWEQFCTSHPDQLKNIQQARKIILQFRTVAHSLSEEEKIILFSRILKQIEEKQYSKKTRRMLAELLKYAAIALVFFSIGALVFYRENKINPSFYSFNLEQITPQKNTQLIRSNGDNIVLNNERSFLKHQRNGELVVNNDTIKPTKPSRNIDRALNQLIVPYGKTSEIILPDGTRAFLNAGSTLVYPEQFTGKTREVLLSGEAYFDVKHNAERPFIVQVNDLRIKDMGTSFNVSAYPSDSRIETVLTQGKLSIRPNNSGILSRDTELVPGQLASYNRQTGQTQIKHVEVENYILWTQGIIKFETTDFSRIVKNLERFYNIRFHFDDPMLGHLQISGKLELKEDMNEVIERIARTASVQIIKKGDDSYEILK